jgi:hypothetical protein
MRRSTRSAKAAGAMENQLVSKDAVVDRKGGKQERKRERQNMMAKEVEFEFDGDKAQKTEDNTDTSQSWQVQGRGQVLYDYDGDGSTGAISRRPDTDPKQTKSAKKKANFLGKESGPAGGFLYRKKRKLTETESYNEADRKYEQKIATYLEGVGGEASATAIANIVKKPKEFGKKFKMHLFMQLRPERFCFDKERKWWKLVVTEGDAEEVPLGPLRRQGITPGR